MNQINNNYSVKIENKIKELSNILYENIEYPCVNVVFQRLKDMEHDIKESLDDIKKIEPINSHFYKLELKYSQEVKNEVIRANSLFQDYHSEHEGFAVLLEEVDELWDAIRLKQSDPTRKEKVKEELIQIAATAHRFLNCLDSL